LSDQFADVFPELKVQQDFVTRVVEEEEKSFLRTLETGIRRFEALNPESGIISGNVVFELSDTFGFPVDLTALLAKEKGLKIDEAGFEKALLEQKTRSRKDSAKEATDWVELNEGNDLDGAAFRFVGYDEVSAEAQIIKYRKVKTKTGEEYHIVLDCTPFYAEMGGQVGDTGHIMIGNHSVNIKDTKKENDLFIHISTDKNIDEILQNAGTVVAHINEERREKIRTNHTVTHLMLAAMRKVLGTHIVQKGSYQDDNISRFDFSHFAKVTDEELGQIEDIVNEKIRENIQLETKVNIPIADAIALGASATFGEKYGDFVRVVIFDPKFSVELCGGTHASSTGKIGLFKFISEGSVAAGVRRVEALTGGKAISVINEQLSINTQLKEVLRNNDLIKAVENLLSEKAVLQKKVEVLENEKLQELKNELAKTAVNINGLNVITAKVSVPSADALKQLCFDLKNKVERLYAVIGAEFGEKPQIAVIIDEEVMKEKNLHAGNIVKELAKEMKGGGGGQPYFATAGGSDASGLDRAIEKGKSFV
jgi:alanyl-tRNA synthetase